MKNLFRDSSLAEFILLTVLILTASWAGLAGDRIPGPVQELKVVSGDVDLFVRVAGKLGSGKAVLAINGGPGVSSRYMTDLETVAGDNLALVTFDQRGVGRSTMPAPEVTNFTFEKYLEDIEAIRKSLGVKSFSILGHSWGGILALKYAIAFPDRVDSLILIGNGPLKDVELKEYLGKMRKRVIELMQLGLIDRKLERHANIYPAYLSDPRFKPQVDLLPDLNEQVMNMTFEAIAGYDLTDNLSRINKRALILWGMDDPIGLDVATATKTALSGARVELIVIKGCGHFWQEKPQEFMDHIRAFLLLASR